MRFRTDIHSFNHRPDLILQDVRVLPYPRRPAPPEYKGSVPLLLWRDDGLQRMPHGQEGHDITVNQGLGALSRGHYACFITDNPVTLPKKFFPARSPPEILSRNLLLCTTPYTPE